MNADPVSLLYLAVNVLTFDPVCQVSEEEVTRLLTVGIQPVGEIYPSFSSFTYTPRSLSDDSTPTVRQSTHTLLEKDTGSVYYFCFLMSLDYASCS